MHLQWPAVLRRFNGCHERDFVAGTTSAFTRLLSSDIGVIDLDTARQLLLALALHHYLHQFVLEFPGRIVVYADLTRQLQGRGALLTLGQQVDGQEPFPQRQFRTMEYGTRRQRALMVALVALVYFAGLKFTAGGVSTFRTDESVWPTELVQCIGALCFAAVFVHEFVQTKACLKLYCILLHDGNPPGFSRFHYAERTDSVAEPRR